jgi:prefoldin beta subunit
MTHDPKSMMIQLQGMEQQLQSFGMQRQQLQAQLLEVESALEEVEGAKTAYRIIGGIMVSADPVALKSELSEKKGSIGVRIKSVERQENSLKDKAQALQEEVLKVSGGKE